VIPANSRHSLLTSGSKRIVNCATTKWFHSISVSIAPCHGAGTGSIPVGTANVLFRDTVLGEAGLTVNQK